jgi:hypothetical protein
MLALIFNQAPSRRIVGLLALGEWGPATGAITGSVASQQAGQQSLAVGTVVEPVVIVVGGGSSGFGGFGFGKKFPSKIPAITGTVRTAQQRQESIALGEMIDTELEMVTAILMAAD